MLIAVVVKLSDVRGNSGTSSYLSHVPHFYKIVVLYFCKLASIYLFLLVLGRLMASPCVQMFPGPACCNETRI